MPHTCADCNHKMMLSPDGSSQSVACERCGGRRLEPDQPSPLRGDGDLRNMVDPGVGLDQGGNPNMEGIWANNGWQSYDRRDESYASVRTAMDFDMGGDFDFESAPRVPSHHVIVDRYGKVYSGQFPETHEEIADRHRLEDSVNGVSKGAVYPEGDTEWYTHDSGHNPAAMEQMLYGHFGTPVTVDPNLQSQSEASRWGLGPQAQPARRELETLEGPANMRSWGQPRDREGLVRGGRIEANNMEALDEHFPFHVAVEQMPAQAPAQTTPPAVQPQGPAYTQEGVIPGSHPNAAKMGDGTNLGIHAGTTKWLGFLDAHVDGQPVRENVQRIIQDYGPQGSRYGQPVTVSAHHPEHLKAAIDVIEHSATGGMPSPKMIEVGRAVQRGEMEPPPGISSSNFKKREARAIYLSFGIGDLASWGAALALAPETGGASLAARAAVPLMKGALMGTGSNLIGGLMGTQDGAGQQTSAPQQPRDLEQLAKVADLETPFSNPGFHDSPDGDPHQFKDGDQNPNPENPNLNGEAGGSQLGEDNVGPSFGPNSPSMQRFELLLPAIMHYYHSDQSAAQDPTIRELHDMLDKESPGYLDSIPDEQGAIAVQHLMDHMRQPPSVHAKMAGPVYQNTPIAPGQMQMGPQQQAMPMHPAQPISPQGMVNCAYCGATIDPSSGGVCQQCGAMNNPMAGAPGLPQGQQGTPQGMTPNGGNPQTTTPFVGKTAGPDDPLPISDYFHDGPQQREYERCPYCKGTGRGPMYMPCMYCGGKGGKIVPKMAADTQGPIGPEQIAAVQQLLLDTGRAPEVPNVPIHPEQYAAELQQVTQGNQTTPPPVDPSQQVQAPPDPSMMGQMPMPGMTAPGGAPAAPGPGGSPFAMSAKVATPHSGAPRCPQCHSATTGFLRNGLEEVAGQCHSCGNVWDIGDAKGIRTADDLNPVAAPAADQTRPYDPSQDQDSSHSWNDQDGDPLIEGQEYELFTGQYPIPDRVRIDAKKPDELLYSTIGQFDASPQDGQPAEEMKYQNRISLQEMQMEKYRFQKADDQNSDAGEQHLDQYSDTSQAPQFTEPVSQPQISPRGHVEEVPEQMTDYCPKCASKHIASQMSSPTTEFHECYKCGHGWETREEEYQSDGAQARAWLHEASGSDDFWAGYDRVKNMEAADRGSTSRSLSAAAARDPRHAEISQRLNENKMAREAGKKFTPYEQRQMIDENGVARNADRMDLSGTHYESHRYLGDKANGMNVPDEELFMGL